MTWKWSEIYTGSHIASKMDSKAKKTLPSGPKVSPKRPLACPTAPQMPPDGSRTPPEALQNAPRTLPKRLRRDPTPPQRTLGASSEHPLAKISSKHVFSWCMQQNHTFDLPDGVKNHFQSTSQAQCKGCMWKQIEESGKKYTVSLGCSIFVASFFVVSLLWKMFEMFSEGLEGFRKLSGWFREVSRPAKMWISLHTSMKNQVCKQYPSKALLRYLRSHREPSWEVLGSVWALPKRLLASQWGVSDASKDAQDHLESRKIHKNSSSKPPSLYPFKPPSLHAFKPACLQGPRRDARSENNL